ncbi:MAG TPA: galactokinase [Bdellovibrionales bacterium]|nr:galactokinase [Bdellovibrionales bacterium]
MKITKQSATRVDLSGGTLDCWPLYLLVDSCVTINLSVSVFTRVTLEEKPGREIEVDIRDLKYRKNFADLKSLLEAKDEELKLVQKHLAYWKPEKGFRLETSSESPVGGGLGGSSSLSISLIKAFAEWLKCDMTVLEMVTLSANLEAQVLHKMTGTQDYFPALVPGLNAIHYTPRGARIETLPVTKEFWDERLTLVYTGQPHHSGLNNWQVLKAALDVEEATLKALRDIRDVSWDMYAALKNNRHEIFPELFNREFEARVRLSSSFSSPEIDRLRNVALKSGAQAVKICGAGGGGCVLVWSRPERKSQVEAGCREQGFEVLNARAVLAGP